MNNVFSCTYESFCEALRVYVDVSPGVPNLVLGLKNMSLSRGIKNNIKIKLTDKSSQIVFIKHLKNALVIIYKDGTEKRCKNVWILIEEILSYDEFIRMCDETAKMSDDYPQGYYVSDFIQREFKRGKRYVRNNV